MGRLHALVDDLKSIHVTCGELMEKANRFAASNDPKLRALAYEIGIGVSRIMADQKPMLEQINEIIYKTQVVTEVNGYGALAE